MTYTRVLIDVFKPTGWIYTFYVPTEDRGAAIRASIAELRDDEIKCINSILASYCGDIDLVRGRLIYLQEDKCKILTSTEK